MKFYLTGPITGYENGNKVAFETAAKNLRSRGYEVISPLELNTPEEEKEALEKHYGEMYWKLLARDMVVISTVNGIIFLPGWEDSKGARLEAYTGLLNNHPFFEYHDEDLEELPHKYIAGVCAAQWVPKEILKKLGLVD